MGFCCRNLYVCFLFLGCIVSALVAVYLSIAFYPSEVPQVPEIWWGKGQKVKDNEEVVKFNINVPNDVLTDLKARLAKTKYSEPLEDANNFEYGFPANKLKEVVKYWKDTYDWRKHEKELNKYQNYKTQIDGISVHFVRTKAANIPKGVKVIPVMLIHGWPGSFYEFYKAIPELIKHRQGSDFVLEVVVPSIPGYGFSENPHKQGFSATQAAKVFHKLMTRLGFDKYYVQGGDWGTVITTNMGILYPQNVLGIHTNGGISRTPLSTVKRMIGSYFPSLIYEKDEIEHIKYFKDDLMLILKESGYMMLQSTKPDTVGSALQDSPAGLAAYILEKFSTWTNMQNRGKADGALTEKFTMDELLTNVMIYYVTDSITSSQRFYKETFSSEYTRTISFDVPIKVPAGIIAYPHELLLLPKSCYTDRYLDLVSYSRMPRGGHFGAFEEPSMLANDLLKFIETVQNRSHKSGK